MMPRPPRRPATDTGQAAAGDSPEEAAAGHKSTQHLRVPLEIKNVIQTLMQHAGSTATRVLDMLDLPDVHWKSNAGVVIRALLLCVGLVWEDDGLRVWRRTNPDDVIGWTHAGGRASLRPTGRQAATALGEAEAGLEHDTSVELRVELRGSAAQRRAAAAAQLEPLRALATVPPDDPLATEIMHGTDCTSMALHGSRDAWMHIQYTLPQ